jgi:hypothetical protein
MFIEQRLSIALTSFLSIKTTIDNNTMCTDTSHQWIHQYQLHTSRDELVDIINRNLEYVRQREHDPADLSPELAEVINY